MIIGLSGKARSGKNTVGDYLEGTYFVHQVALADKIKAILKDLFFLTPEQLHGDDKFKDDPRYGCSPRYMMQYFGTEMARKFNPDIWVQHVAVEVAKIQKKCPGAVTAITDVRFINEIDWIKHQGGQIWRIIRTDDSPEVGGIEGHASEVSLDVLPNEAFDHVLIAKGGEIDKLYDKADAAFNTAIGS